MRIRTEVASILRDLKITNVKCQYDAENLAAKQHFESEVEYLKDMIRSDIEEKLRRLEEDRNTAESELWNETYAIQSSMSPYGNKKRKRGSFAGQFPNGQWSQSNAGNDPSEQFRLVNRDQLNLPDRRKKPVTIAGPYIVYMLHDNEIMDDYLTIKKALRSTIV